MKPSILTFSLSVPLALVGCRLESAPLGDQQQDANTLLETFDITDVNFTRRDGTCTDYIGRYVSEVTDVKENRRFRGELTVSDGGDHCELTTNMIPNHDFDDGDARFATPTSEQDGHFDIPAVPVAAGNPSPLSLGTVEAVLLNGVTVDLLAAACWHVGDEMIGCGNDQLDNPWRFDPMSPLNHFGTDSHNAHTQPGGKYHYHGNPLAMFQTDCEVATGASPVIGFAADGYPIYGSCIDDGGTVREVEPSYVLKSGTRVATDGYDAPLHSDDADVVSDRYDGQFRGDWEYIDGSGDLDECNGMTVDGQYGYYVTNGFPWVLNCYKGQVDASFSSRAQLARRSHGHDPRTPHHHNP